ncbi:MAG: TatD family hydrolase [Bacteriovoracaceae bacterium]|nr:TatD family hydrolase [Bacteriovoracaceae bacterium]
MFIDVHAYHLSAALQILVGIDTIAIHPWELKSPFDQLAFDNNWIDVCKKSYHMLAIGECGLDRAHENIVDIDTQKEVLKKHFELANERSLPIIIHSVRAYSDLLGMLKRKPFKNNILLHAFGGNDYEVQELLKYPVYFSYGARLLKNPLTISIIPIDRLLLETGDQTEISIEQIYSKAAELLNISIPELQKIIKKNFLTFFNQSNDESSSDFIKNLNIRHKPRELF